MSKKAPKELRFSVSDELHAAVLAAAKRREENIGEYCRRIVSASVSEDAAKDGIDVVTRAVRETLKNVQKPMEERLAKIAAKNAIQAGTNYYLLLDVLATGNMDVQTMKENARKKSVADLQRTDMNKE